jgi:predicted O-methyltransferase YrrM
MTDFEQLAQIEGLTPAAVGEHLYGLAARVPADQAVVELGVYKGRTACYLAAGARSGQGARVWAFDPWDLPGHRVPYTASVKRRRHRVQFTSKQTRLQAKRNVHRAGLRDRVTLVRGFSVEEGERWAGPPVGLLYVDGDHRYDAVHADFEAWRPHLVDGAVVVFDDYAKSHHEVIEAVDAMVAAGDLELVEVICDRLAVTRLPGATAPEPEPEPEPEVEVERPKASEPKAAWETWARAAGYDTEGLTKADLMKLGR